MSTPKRVLGLLGSQLDLAQLHWLIVDEVDKLLQDGEREAAGFREQLANVHAAAAASPHLRRAFFSATFAPAVEDWAKVAPPYLSSHFAASTRINLDRPT